MSQYPQNTLSISYNKDILLHNSNTTIKIRKLTLALYYYLILDSSPASCEPLVTGFPSADQHDLVLCVFLFKVCLSLSQ